MRATRQIVCPFCRESVPAPRRVTTVFTPGGCLAEHCSCGAVYAVDETGRLDRKKMGELVFGDEEARETLNAILHPRIGAAGAKYIQGYQDDPAPYVIYEGALLVETGAYQAFSALIVCCLDWA